jgi:hypothetical protein
MVAEKPSSISNGESNPRATTAQTIHRRKTCSAGLIPIGRHQDTEELASDKKAKEVVRERKEV